MLSSGLYFVRVFFLYNYRENSHAYNICSHFEFSVHFFLQVNESEAIRIAREWTRTYAMGN